MEVAPGPLLHYLPACHTGRDAQVYTAEALHVVVQHVAQFQFRLVGSAAPRELPRRRRSRQLTTMKDASSLNNRKMRN